MGQTENVTIGADGINRAPEDQTTEIVCIIDRSTSIRTSGLVGQTIEGFNSFIAEQKKLPGKAKLTLCLFDGGSGYGNTIDSKTYEVIHDGVDLNTVPELNETTFSPKGMTAMYDAIGYTLDTLYSRLKGLSKEESPDKVVVLVMTDGEENSSKEYNQKTVFDLIKKRRDEDKWAFVFIGANIDTMQVGGNIGVSRGSTLSYTASNSGVNTAYTKMSESVSKLRSSKASMRSIDLQETALYSATIDNLMENKTTSSDDDKDEDKG